MEVTVGKEDCWYGFIELPEDHKVGYNYNMFERLHQENWSMYKSFLLLCRKTDPVKYGTNGVATLTNYLQSFSHVQRKGGWKVDWLQDSWVRSCQESWRELWSLFHVFQYIFNFNITTPQPTVHVVNRASNMEAMVCAFLAEYSFSFFITFFFFGSAYDWDVLRTL